MFDNISKFGITSRAFNNNICSLKKYNPRDFVSDPYRRIDDTPFGGGPGMVMKIEPLELALNKAKAEQLLLGNSEPLKVYLSPQGKKIDQQMINDLSKRDGIIFVCGRYEGVDERFIKRNIDLELSLGDFVVSGGELPAMMVIDSIIRQLDGALNDGESAVADSFMNGLLDYPHYTKPRVYDGEEVPEVLLSGDHKQIEKWRLKMSLSRTLERRPDLLEKRDLNKIESGLLAELVNQFNLK